MATPTKCQHPTTDVARRKGNRIRKRCTVCQHVFGWEWGDPKIPRTKMVLPTEDHCRTVLATYTKPALLTLFDTYGLEGKSALHGKSTKTDIIDVLVGDLTNIARLTMVGAF